MILKPESNFKGLRSFLTHLPIDYYILLQQGYNEPSNTEQHPVTNFVYVENIPLLSRKKTYFRKTDPVSQVQLEDLYKCSNKLEAEQFLHDPYACDEMIRHLSERYGEVTQHFFVNYNKERILQ